ncbi:MAG: formate dehydrogenase subunit delta [Parvularculaceae bacterium]
MERADLIRMANQISQFFEAYGEEEAVEGVANHLRMFWAPRMRCDLVAALKENTDGARPAVVSAAAKLADGG